jgi:putative ABC transport system permease protein
MRAPRPLRRLMALFKWDARDRDMDREMAFHVDSLTRDYMREGLNAEDAARAARRRFGSVTRLKEEGHDVRTAPFAEHLARDVRHMSRGLRRSPGFALAVILTLALGIGGNTAIFSVVDQLLLRPLPYPHGEQLVMLHETLGFAPNTAAGVAHSVSPANWLDWQRDSRTLQQLAAWRTATYTLTGVGEPLRLNAQLVSSEFFPVLGVEPLLGRTIADADDRPNAPLVAVLSYALWQHRFGGDPAVIGRVVQFNDRPVQIAGVMPASFRFVYQDTDVWVPFRLDRNQQWRETAGRFMNVVARLDPRATLASSRAEMTTIAQRLAATYEFNKHSSVIVVPLREELTGQVYTSLMVLYGAVAVLLSIACFNVANLLLARAASRRREIAIRTSLGAGRLAIIRQLLVESVILAVIGGALGIVLARWSLDALVAFAPANLLPVSELFVDRRVLFYAALLSLSTGVIVGLAPALLVARRPIVSALRASGIGVAQSPRVRQALVVCQVAMTVILLCGAGLLVKTVSALNRTNNGFDKRDVLTMEVALPGTRYNADKRVAFYRTAVDALRALPGVTSVAAADNLPVIGMPRGSTAFHRLGTPEVPVNERASAVIRVVTPGFFSTLRIPVLRGREFTDADLGNPATGFIVNAAFVKAHLSGIDPLTASISVLMEPNNPHLPIIGVVGDVSEGSVRDDAQPTVYYSHRRLTEATMTLFMRGSQPEDLAKPAVASIHAIDPALAVTKIRTLENALADSVARERLSALVSGGFALSGLLLASLGLYGLLAFLVAERTKEIGIRIALGARRGRLTGSVIGGGLRLVAIGAAIGIAGSLLLLRLFGTMLFGVTPYDPLTYAGVLALLASVAIIAAYLPARRAARIEPLLALRQD